MSTEPAPGGVVILGGASAVARALAHEFARAGHPIVLGDFDADECSIVAADVAARFQTPCHALPFDALDYGAHAGFLDECNKALGGLPEGVVACFGYMAEQSACQSDFAKSHRTIDTNFTGLVSILEVFAAAFEERGSGFIAAISSVAGDRGRMSNYIYGASKAGATAYLAGLRNRMHHAGVHVVTVKPGFMDTKMTYGMPLPRPLVASPAQAARDIYRAILKREDTVYVRFFWRYIMLIIRAIPEWKFKKMRM